MTGDGPDTFDEPGVGDRGARTGDIFVGDGHRPATGKTTRNDRIVKFSKDGKFIKTWGKRGAAPGEIREPHSFSAIDSQGRLFVADRENNRIQIFDQDGHFLDQWTQFGRPSGLFIAKDDTLYVADSESFGVDQPGWKKGIRIGSAKTGKVAAFIEDMESTTGNTARPKPWAPIQRATSMAEWFAARCWRSMFWLSKFTKLELLWLIVAATPLAAQSGAKEGEWRTYGGILGTRTTRRRSDQRRELQ